MRKTLHFPASRFQKLRKRNSFLHHKDLIEQTAKFQVEVCLSLSKMTRGNLRGRVNSVLPAVTAMERDLKPKQ